MMGRSFQSVRMGVNNIAGRWECAARAMRSNDGVYANKVVTMAKTYASEAFYAFDDPLEAAMFSVLICMQREHEPDSLHASPGGVSGFPKDTSCHPPGKSSGQQGNGEV
jgi:hypothetical protein